jgi:hypothetical protein
LKYILFPKTTKMPSYGSVKAYFKHFNKVQIRRKWYFWGDIQKIHLSSEKGDTEIEFIEEILAGKHIAVIYNWGHSHNVTHDWWAEFGRYQSSVEFIISLDTHEKNIENFSAFLEAMDGMLINLED